MKKMLAIILTAAFIVTTMPLQLCFAVGESESGIKLRCGEKYILRAGDVCMTAEESATGLLGVPYSDDVPDSAIWQYTDEHCFEHGGFAIGTNGQGLTLTQDTSCILIAESEGGIHFSDGEHEIYIRYIGEENRFDITDDADFSCKLTAEDVSYIPVSGVELSVTAVTLEPGTTYTLTAHVIPYDAANQDINFESSSPFVADVDADGTVTAKREGTAEIKATAEGDVYAVCTVTVSYRYFKVRFLDMDGSVIDEQSVREGTAAKAPQIPAHTGYDFTGWVPSDFDNITQDMDIRSSWSMTVFDITLVLNGGVCDDFPATYTVASEKLILPVPVRTGYTFSGWYENEELSGSAVTAIDAGSSGDKIFYAAWDLINYSITYDTAGGRLTGAYLTVYNIESPDIYLPVPVRTGYEFAGWHIPGDGTIIECIHAGSYGNLDLCASWRPVIYSITYELSGGSFESGSVTTYTIESGYIMLPLPVRRGYEFMGWYENTLFTGNSVDGISTGTHGDLHFYAKWSIIRYSLTLHLCGGTTEGVFPAAYTVESEDIVLPAVKKTGYTFIAWYDNPDFSGNSVLSVPSGSVGDRDFYARFDIIKYSITFVTNGGIFSGTVPAGFDIESPDIKLPVPQKTAYTFSGWYASAALTGNPVDVIYHGTVGNIVLYAAWTPIKYSIVYHTNGGDMTGIITDSYTIESDDLYLPVVTKRGYDFAGWYENAVFSGDPVSKIAHGSYGIKSFFARWVPTRYAISYETNGGSLPEQVPYEYNIETQDFSLPVPTRRGYTFAGWYADRELSGAVISVIHRGSTGSFTLYAAWDIVHYHITYNTNGGAIVGQAADTYTIESDTQTLPDVIRKGYIFRGWYVNPSCTGLRITSIPAGSVGDIVLYAGFDTEKYHITYNTYGGELTYAPTEYTIETNTIILPEPARIGYDFSGWYQTPDCTGLAVYAIPRGSTGDIVLYASWDVIHYSITYYTQGGELPAGALILEYTIESDTIPLPIPKKEGYVHTGWYETEECLSVPLRTIEHGSYGDKILYSGWRRLKFFVRFYDRDYNTLLASMYVEYGMAATPPESVPEHEGCYFSGWNGDTGFIKADTDFIAVYELIEYDVTFTDLDFSVIEIQKVKHGCSAVPPVPPEHEGCVFVFWSCDYSCITEDLTVTAVYRATTVTPRPVSGQRFIHDERMNTGEDYIIAVKCDDNYYALTSLGRNNTDGLWGLPVEHVGNTIRTHDETISVADAVFHAEGSESAGFSLTAETGGRLNVMGGDFFVTDTEEEKDLFSYHYRNGAWRLYDRTKNVYLRYVEEDGYFTAGTLAESSAIILFKRINLPDYIQKDEPYLNRLYTVVAVRPDGTSYALTEKDGGLFGTPVEVADGKLYFYDNVDERPIAFRMVFGNNEKGFSLRSASSMKYLGTGGAALVLTDYMENYWVYGNHPVSGDMSLCEINSGQYVFCSQDGVFSAENSITHTRIYLFERTRPTGRQGDINLDGTVNTGDAVLLLKYCADAVSLYDEQKENADTNSDGRVNTGDAVVVLRYAVGLIDWLG